MSFISLHPRIILPLFILSSLASGAIFGGLFSHAQLWATLIKLSCLTALFFSLKHCKSSLQAFFITWVWAGALAFSNSTGWLYYVLYNHVELSLLSSAFAMFLFSAYTGCFCAIAAAIAHQAKKLPYLFNISFVSLWLLSEALRGVAFAEFPMFNLAFAFVDSPFSGYASTLGTLGVSAAAIGLAISVVTLSTPDRLWALSAGALIVIIGYLGASIEYTKSHESPINVALLQGNVTQRTKPEPEDISNQLLTYFSLIKQAEKNNSIDLVITPESAIPIPFDMLPSKTQDLFKPEKSTLLITTMWFNDKNNLDKPDPSTVSSRMYAPFSGSEWFYEKVHLMPFAERIPYGFNSLVEYFKLPFYTMKQGGENQKPFEIKKLLIAPFICLDGLFFHKERARASEGHILLNTSNLAWYGNTNLLNFQKNVAKLGAIAAQKPMLLVSNTGMTLSIGKDGEIKEQLEKHTNGILRASVQGMNGSTPYTFWGDWAMVFLASMVLSGWIFLKTATLFQKKK
jgi:apolipoprotein N-acyltransferase